MKAILLLIPLLCLNGCDAPGTDGGAAAPPQPARTVIAADGAPAAIGPYSQAVQVGRALYLSGQIGLDPETGALVEGGVEAETRRVMDNLAAVLAAAGYGMEDVVQVQVFLADLADYQAMNAVYASYLGERPPARAAVQVARLPRDARVEIMMTAVK